MCQLTDLRVKYAGSGSRLGDALQYTGNVQQQRNEKHNIQASSAVEIEYKDGR